MSRPVHLNLTTFRFPITAVVSILHRVSGVVLTLGLVYALYLASMSLGSKAGFDAVLALATEPIHKFLMWAVLTATTVHVVAGIRHLAVDLHLGDDIVIARVTSWVTLGLSGIVSLVAAWWLWIWL